LGSGQADFLKKSLVLLVSEIDRDGHQNVSELAEVLRKSQRLAVQLYPDNSLLKSLDDSYPESLSGIRIRAEQIALALGIELSDRTGPSEIASKMENAGVAKTKIDAPTTFLLAVLAGAFISLGGIYFTFATAQQTISGPFTQVLGGLTFSLGLILVVVAGAELFTGNNLMVTALISKKIRLSSLLRNWAIVYVGNLVGAILTSLVLYMSNAWSSNGYQYGLRALSVASIKVNHGFVEAFFLGILCNSLVCMAIWMASGGRRISEKVLAVIFPISAFVAIGFEHSVANMYFLSFALMIKGDSGLASAMPDISNIGLDGVIGNLVPVTLGNIVGGAVFVGAVYWFVYLRKKA
jgi:formate/nitrite transporter